MLVVYLESPNLSPRALPGPIGGGNAILELVLTVPNLRSCYLANKIYAIATGPNMMIVDEVISSLIPQIEKIPVFSTANGPDVFMVRLDRVVPFASGNKIYKLLGNIEYARREGYTQLLSFGGAFSNHIHALALTAERIGMDSIGIIRGEEHYAGNPTLSDAKNAGMHLEFVDRMTYRKRNDSHYLQDLQNRFPNALIIPEGGANPQALDGCRLIPRTIEKGGLKPDLICCACGTGTTLAGILAGLGNGQQCYGYCVLKDQSIAGRIYDLLAGHTFPVSKADMRLIPAEFGGYARLNHELIEFVLYMLERTGILLDPIYTAKLCLKLRQQIDRNCIAGKSRIAVIHSGGIQAWRGMRYKVVKLAGKSAWDRINAALASETEELPHKASV